jgi:hypothetical protein
VSGAIPLWDLAREDMAKTYRATKDSCVKILLRGLYTAGRERGRLAEGQDDKGGVRDVAEPGHLKSRPLFRKARWRDSLHAVSRSGSIRCSRFWA